MSSSNPWKIRSKPGNWARTKAYQNNDCCPHCLDLWTRNYRPNVPGHIGDEMTWFGFHSSIEVLLHREAAGCKFCSVLLEGLMLFRSTWDGVPEAPLELLVIMKGPRPTIEVTVPLHKWTYQRIMLLSIEFFTETGQSTPWPWPFGSAFEVPSSPLSKPTLEFITRNIQTCKRYHNLCKQEDNVLPRRVLDVRAGPSRDAIRLIETTGQVGQYVTLSHCWGGKVSLMTTTKTRERHIRGISWTKLPKTFLDAVIVTRLLGLQYLWIDSLCILQDDVLDWQEQSADMARIYKDSEITIVATRAPNSGAGFLGSRGITKQIQTDLVGHNGEDEIVISVRQTPTHNETPGAQFDGINKDPESCPLVDRGWCFQERMLGTRLIHFTPSEVIFECHTESACECSHSSAPTLPLKTDLAKIMAKVPLDRHITVQGYDKCLCALRADAEASGAKPQTKSDPSILHGHREGRNVTQSICVTDDLDLWFSIVETYSSRIFTYDKDILPALSGIASTMINLRDRGEYLAGLWTKNVPLALTWNSINESACHRIDSVSTPTWSWASRTGKVVWRRHHYLSEHWVEFVAGATETNNINPFGDVHAGYVTLRSRVIEVAVTGSPESWAIRLPGNVLRKCKSHLYVDTATDSQNLVEGEPLLCMQLCGYDDVQNPATKFSELRALALEAQGFEIQDTSEYDDYVFMAMILTDDPEFPGTKFRRIGIAVDVDPYWFKGQEKREIIIL